jgi:hypothetical protein
MSTLAVGYDFGSAFFLINRTHGPTCLGGIIRNVINMPEFVVHFGFLYSNNLAKIKTNMWGWCGL